MAKAIDIWVPPVFEPLFKAGSRYYGAHGGRGSGKSHAFATKAVVYGFVRPFRLVCVREVQRSIADSVKRLIEDKIAEFELDAHYTITDHEIRGRNGSLFIFRGLQNHTAASIKSLEGFDAAWVEEAQTISQKSLDLLIPTIRKAGSELWFSWNPENEDDPVDVLLRTDPPENATVVEANWNDNPHFPEELRSDMERDKDRDPDKYAHVWGGEYRGLSEARVFRNWRVGELDPPDNVVWFYGADWGFANDETAALRCCIIGKSLYIDHEVYELGVPTDALPMFMNGLPDARKWPMRGDNARPETIDYLRRHGFPKLRPCRKGKGSVEDGVSFIQGMDVVIHPRCANTAREFAGYAYKTDPRTGEILPVVEDKNNHLIDALRYAVEGLHRKGKLLPSPETEADNRRGADYGIDDEETGDTWKIV